MQVHASSSVKAPPSYADKAQDYRTMENVCERQHDVVTGAWETLTQRLVGAFDKLRAGTLHYPIVPKDTLAQRVAEVQRYIQQTRTEHGTMGQYDSSRRRAVRRCSQVCHF